MPSAPGPSVSGLDRQRLLPAALEARLIGTLGRGSGLLLLLAVAAVWVSLVSWSVADPSLTHATGGPVRNALGAPGAIVADLMLQTLGLAAAVALLPLMIWAFELVLSQHVAGLRTKATYYPFAVLGVAAAVAALPTSTSWPIEHGYGGILGDVIFNVVASALGFVNTKTASLASGILLAGLGMSSLIRALGVTRADVLPRRHAPHAGAPWATNSAPASAAFGHLPRVGSLAAALNALRTLAQRPAPVARTGHGAMEPVLPGVFIRHQEQPRPAPRAPGRHTPDYAARRPVEDSLDDLDDADIPEDDDIVPATEDAAL